MRWPGTSAFVALAVLQLLGSCSATSPPRRNVQPGASGGAGEEDLERCALLCEKQRRCAGQDLSEESVTRCADGCFRSISQHPHLAARLRTVAGCLDEPCGEDFDACADKAGVALGTSPAPDQPPPPAPPLDRDRCGVVCKKTFQCLGSAMTPEGIEACVVSCVQTSGEATDSGRRLHAIHGCAAVPCGPDYQRCVQKAQPGN